MKGLVTKVKNPIRKNIVLFYQGNLEHYLDLLKEEWEPMSESQNRYMERTERNIYHAPFVLGYSVIPTPEELKKIDKIILSDKKKKAKDLKDAEKERDAILKAAEDQSTKEEKTPAKRAKKTPVKKPATTVKAPIKKSVTKTDTKKTAIKSVTKTAKKPVTKKSVARKPVAKKPVVKKTATKTAKKPVVKKTATKTAKKPVVKKTATTKKVVKRVLKKK